MHDWAAEAHCFAWLWSCVEGVVISIETVEVSCFLGEFGFDFDSGLAFWWGVGFGFRSFGSAPASLAYEESGSNGAGVDLFCVFVDD